MFQVVKSSKTKAKQKQEFALWLQANPGPDCQHGVMRSQREADLGGSDSWSRHVEGGRKSLIKEPLPWLYKTRDRRRLCSSPA